MWVDKVRQPETEPTSSFVYMDHINIPSRQQQKKKFKPFFRSRVPLFHRKSTSSDRPRPGPLQNTTLRLEMRISWNASQCLFSGQFARNIPVFPIPSHPKNPTCSFCCPALPWRPSKVTSSKQPEACVQSFMCIMSTAGSH